MGWGQDEPNSQELGDVQRILEALRRNGPMRERDLKKAANVHSIGSVYPHLRNVHGVGRLKDYHNWPDDNDKLYFLEWTCDPEWAYASFQRALRSG